MPSAGNQTLPPFVDLHPPPRARRARDGRAARRPPRLLATLAAARRGRRATRRTGRRGTARRPAWRRSPRARARAPRGGGPRPAPRRARRSAPDRAAARPRRGAACDRASGSGAHVEAAEGEEIEHEVGGRPLERGARDVRGARELRALLERLRRRPAIRAEHDHLAVEDGVERQQLDRLRDLRVERRRVLAAPVAERDARALAPREETVAGVRELEQPARARRTAPSRVAATHGASVRRRERRRGAPSRSACASGGLGATLAGGELLEEPPGQHRLLRETADPGRPTRHPGASGGATAACRPASAPRADERPLAVKLVARELEDELAAREPVVRVSDRPPRPADPRRSRRRRRSSRQG